MTGAGFQEPWTLDDDGFGLVVKDAAGRQVTHELVAELGGGEEECMQRIVACVNYCAGLTNEHLEDAVALRGAGVRLVDSPAGVLQ